MGRGKRGAVAFGLLAASLAACDGPGLVGPPPDDVAIPADVVAPLLTCDGAVGSIAIQMPCQVGQLPVSEVDCTLGGAAAGEQLKFMMAPSLPGGDFGKSVVLGAPTSFHPMLLPGGNPLLNGQYSISSISGTVSFTALSLSEQRFDGWFRHLDVLLAGRDGSIVSCSLAEGRFTAVPGSYL